MFVRFAAAGAAHSTRPLGHVLRSTGLGLIMLVAGSGLVSAQSTNLLIDVEQSTYDGNTVGEPDGSPNGSTDYIAEEHRNPPPLLEQGGKVQGPEKTSKALR